MVTQDLREFLTNGHTLSKIQNKDQPNERNFLKTPRMQGRAILTSLESDMSGKALPQIKRQSKIYF
jgi:hypothetical protein